VIVLLRALNPVEYVKGGGQSMMKTDVCRQKSGASQNQQLAGI